MSKYGNPAGLTCSFCHKSQREVEKIIAGPNVYICSDCIKLCMDIIEENGPERPVTWGEGRVPSPSRIKEELDRYVIGQERAKKRISVAVYNHYKRLEANRERQPDDTEVQKSNVLLIGPTGTGKTLIAQTLARFLDVPFVIADATTLTEAGYVGEDVENMIHNLFQAAGQSVDKAIRGIVYVDEIDKVARRGSTSSVSRDVSGEGVQQALLKLLEGTTANIQVKGKGRVPNQDAVQIDTSNILFICGGAFEGLASIVERRLGRRAVGFHRDDDTPDADIAKANRDAMLQRVTPGDLSQFGLIPEFIGRLPVLAVMDPLDTDDLVHVLTEPRNALVKQYQKLLKMEKIELRFTDDALRAIAEEAISRRSGARGLRAVTERVMLDVMFDAPSVDNLREIVITEETVRGGRPTLKRASEAGVPS